jgi:hypothetical protein
MDMDDMQEPDEIDESQLIDAPHATQSTQPWDFGLKPRRPFQRWTLEQKTRYHRLRPRLRRHAIIEEEDEEDAEAARRRKNELRSKSNVDRAARVAKGKGHA